MVTLVAKNSNIIIILIYLSYATAIDKYSLSAKAKGTNSG